MILKLSNPSDFSLLSLFSRRQNAIARNHCHGPDVAKHNRLCSSSWFEARKVGHCCQGKLAASNTVALFIFG